MKHISLDLVREKLVEAEVDDLMRMAFEDIGSLRVLIEENGIPAYRTLTSEELVQAYCDRQLIEPDEEFLDGTAPHKLAVVDCPDGRHWAIMQDGYVLFAEPVSA